MENTGKVDYHAVMTAEVKVDCYSGPNCDQQRKLFNIYCDGDMQDDDTSDKKLVIKLDELPPGALVTVNYPCCPKCSLPRQDKMRSRGGSYKTVGHEPKCDCGFDWESWAEDQYS